MLICVSEYMHVLRMSLVVDLRSTYVFYLYEKRIGSRISVSLHFQNNIFVARYVLEMVPCLWQTYAVGLFNFTQSLKFILRIGLFH